MVYRRIMANLTQAQSRPLFQIEAGKSENPSGGAISKTYLTSFQFIHCQQRERTTEKQHQ
jgi:hypothetical protein